MRFEERPTKTKHSRLLSVWRALKKLMKLQTIILFLEINYWAIILYSKYANTIFFYKHYYYWNNVTRRLKITRGFVIPKNNFVGLTICQYSNKYNNQLNYYGEIMLGIFHGIMYGKKKFDNHPTRTIL